MLAIHAAVMGWSLFERGETRSKVSTGAAVVEADRLTVAGVAATGAMGETDAELILEMGIIISRFVVEHVGYRP